MTQQKAAAKRFAQTVLKADGTNYVAVVILNNGSKVVCRFTKSLSRVKRAINGITAKGRTNMRASFADANALLKKAPSGLNVIKNMILCSDGLPQTGKIQTSGRYTKKDHSYYKYANAVYTIDKKMKAKDYFIYSLGFFHNSTGKKLTFGKRLMKDLASKDKYYVIQDSSDLGSTFKKIANQIVNVSLSDQAITIKVGKTKRLTAYKNGIKTTAKWSSKDPSIATVNKNGTVKGIKKGKTIVYAKVDGKKVACTVTVKAKKDITKDFILYGDAVLQKDGSVRLTECTTWQGGSAWYPKPVNATKGLDVSFQYWAGGGINEHKFRKFRI